MCDGAQKKLTQRDKTLTFMIPWMGYAGCMDMGFLYWELALELRSVPRHGLPNLVAQAEAAQPAWTLGPLILQLIMR